MTLATQASSNWASQLVNTVLAIKPLASLAKSRARNMMIQRAESIGVPWRQTVKTLQSRGSHDSFSPEWETDLEAVRKADLIYPDYYVTSFHAYQEGNLGWQPAMEVEVAARAVHARIWPEGGAQGDAMLRQSYHDVLKAQLPEAPRDIVDLGCSVGMSTFALQETFPEAHLTGVDLSPYFLAVAQYRDRQRHRDQGASSDPASVRANRESPLQHLSPVKWVHAAAENTGLPDASFDLVSACLMFHELPQSAAIAIFQEARRLLSPGGHFAIMDMNPQSEVFVKMPPFVLTLLKSTEPYLDEYFGLDFASAIAEAGFTRPTVTYNSPRHRALIAQAV